MSTTSFRAPAKRSPASMPEYQRQNFATPGADASARLSDSAAGIYERGADQTGRQLMALGGAIPEKDIPQVDQWLRVRGLPLTEKNRRAAYTQFLKAKNADAQGAEN